MHIEIDVLEMVVLIITVYAVKWGFRLLFIGVLAKLINEAKNKAVGAIENVKQSFASDGQTRQDAEYDK